MNWRSFLHRQVKVLHHDVSTGLIALEKPIKILSHPNVKGPNLEYRKSIFSLPYNLDKEKYSIISNNNTEEDQSIYLLNRLDLATSGIILVSTSESTARTVKKALAERSTVVKKYYAISIVENNSFGYFPLNMDIVWEDHVKVLSTLSKVRMVGANDDSKCDGRSKKKEESIKTKTAITSAKLCSLHPFKMSDKKGIQRLFHLAFLELTPVTGLTHQLRYQCALHGFPLLGDRVYGNFQRNKLFNKYFTPPSSSSSSSSNTDILTRDNGCIVGKNDMNMLVNSYSRLFLHSFSIEINLTTENSIDTSGYKFSSQSSLPQEFTNLLHDIKTHSGR